jgi:hypothetical protein
MAYLVLEQIGGEEFHNFRRGSMNGRSVLRRADNFGHGVARPSVRA